ncbi:hypothetical protein BKA69DRAFT_1041718 [Paraphysoderma sedebokerense]|nr:hypothetical protein BKA69DRAFT_1041718 [Paraphysoderma sedebokerense]
MQTQHISHEKVEDSKGINSCERITSRSNSLSAADLLVQKESALETTNSISRTNSTENMKRSRSSWSIGDFDEVNSSIRAASKNKNSSNSALNLQNSIKASPQFAASVRGEDVNSDDKSTSKADKPTLMEEKTVRPMSLVIHPSSSAVQKENRRSTTSPNVLIAVLALLKELDHDGLSIVQREISNALLK